MSGQILRQFAFPPSAAGRISVIIAQTVLTGKGQSFVRVVDAIEPSIKEDVAQKAEAACKMPNVLPPHVRSRAASLRLTSLDHVSDLDPTVHSTGEFYDKDGKFMGKIHIAKDPSQQQPMRE
ncbi:hypothetical protein ONS95_001624 [Cadophora gregata]|uniref:uncharacterized protein n=1 Tax=Cadophora gregata TaxID=51156 RepID=UPI0026DD6E83|nr:uncharacterized protein ONS95_001624 [Cadophora gregata]KAK0111252.1 hypothetical protein ONS95_001624 [Cadophora gregata]KAK0112277.1 hypothetical protein ONS96_001525 [Cadophora gregata f. sp. sojae]